MNLILAIIIVACLMGGAALLIPVLTIGLFILVSGGFLLLWLLPIMIIATSDKTTGGEKFAWILAIVFMSWFAWIFYFLLAPIKQKPRYTRQYY